MSLNKVISILIAFSFEYAFAYPSCNYPDRIISTYRTVDRQSCVTSGYCYNYGYNPSTGKYEYYYGYHSQCSGYAERENYSIECRRADGSTYRVDEQGFWGSCQIR